MLANAKKQSLISHLKATANLSLAMAKNLTKFQFSVVQIL
jgi:hypothetical protein